MRYILAVVVVIALGCGGWWYLHQKKTATVEASNVIGNILYVEGSATLTPQGGAPQPAAVQQPVHMNDVIQTAAKSRLFLLLIDNTQFTLSENSRLTVDRYIFDPDDNSANSSRYSVMEGAFQYVSGLIAKKPDPDVSIDTEVGEIGVRGTDITAGIVNGQYQVQVDEGAVNLRTGGGEVTINKGQMTGVLGASAAPGFPSYFNQEQAKPLRQMVAVQDPATLQQRVQQMQGQQQMMQRQYKQYMRQQPGGPGGQGGPGGMQGPGGQGQGGPGGPGGQRQGMGGPGGQGGPGMGGPGGPGMGGPGGQGGPGRMGGPGGQGGPGQGMGGPGGQGGPGQGMGGPGGQGGPGQGMGGPGGQGGPGQGMGGPGGQGGPGQGMGGPGGQGGPGQGMGGPGGQGGPGQGMGGPGGQGAPGGQQGGTRPAGQAPGGGGGSRPARGGGNGGGGPR